jgi:long-chain acyl-CoA synthetase
MFFSQPAHLAKAEELKQEPPKGTAYSVAIPGTEQPGRSRVYRAWNAQKELVKTLDPQVRGASRQIRWKEILMQLPF